MPDTKHTPGEWLRSGTVVYALNDGGTNRMTAQIYQGFTKSNRRTDTAEIEATAQVMSAAAELLSSSRAWIDWMDSPGDGTDKTFDEEQALIQAIRDAIAKAEGRDLATA